MKKNTYTIAGVGDIKKHLMPFMGSRVSGVILELSAVSVWVLTDVLVAE